MEKQYPKMELNKYWIGLLMTCIILGLSCEHQNADSNSIDHKNPAEENMPASISTVHKDLQGKWYWFVTDPSTEGDLIHKRVCQCSKMVVFKADTIIEYYENDTLRSSSSYSLARDDEGKYIILTANIPFTDPAISIYDNTNDFIILPVAKTGSLSFRPDGYSEPPAYLFLRDRTPSMPIPQKH